MDVQIHGFLSLMNGTAWHIALKPPPLEAPDLAVMQIESCRVAQVHSYALITKLGVLRATMVLLGGGSGKVKDTTPYALLHPIHPSQGTAPYSSYPMQSSTRSICSVLASALG